METKTKSSSGVLQAVYQFNDVVLQILNSYSTSSKNLDLAKNTVPSTIEITHKNNLIAKE
jgi:hypothetical protein